MTIHSVETNSACRSLSTAPVLDRNPSTQRPLPVLGHVVLTEDLARFYAPWCGHCQNLKTAYERAATNLAGLAKVAAINCDEDSNKPFCSQMGVQGFPTLKIIRPGSKGGKPMVEDYQGPRTAKGIVETVTDKIPNHVKKLQDSELNAWLAKTNNTAKAILFTEKGKTSALLRSVTIDFLGSISVAQMQSKETAAVEMFGITKFPSLVLLPGGVQEPRVYAGEMKKESMVAFLTQAASPNPDPAPKRAKASSSKKVKPSSSQASAFSEASESHKSADASEAAASASTIVLEDLPTESPDPIVPSTETPVSIPNIAPPIPTLSTPAQLKTICLAPKSGNCILVLLPALTDTEAALPQSASSALGGLADIAEKHVKRHAKLFPFYTLPADNEAAKIVRNELGLQPDSELEIIVVNMKRGWWRRHAGESYEFSDMERFVDNIILGEGSKEKLPEGFFAEAAREPPLAEQSETPAEAPEPEPAEVVDEIPLTGESETAPVVPEPVLAEPEHDEL